MKVLLENNNNFFYIISKVLIIFMIIYDTSFYFLPSVITTARISILLILFISLFKKVEFDKRSVLFLLILIMCIIISMLQGGGSGDFTQTSRLLFFGLYSFIGAYLFKYFVKNREELLWYFLIACFIQSCILIYSFFNPSFKELIAQFIVFGGNFDYTNLYRAFGLSSATGAALSVIQSFGVISAVLLMLFYSDKYKPTMKLVTVILGLICLYSTLFVGRTGLLVSLVFVFYYLVSKFKLKSLLLTSLFLILLTFFDANYYLKNSTQNIDDFSYEYFSNWLWGTFDMSDRGTFTAIARMDIPSLNWNTIVGTGYVVNKDGSNASGHDSGYVQAYYSLGLLFAAVFYISFLIYLLSCIKGRENFKFLFFLLIAILYLIEYKEPFIFKYAFPFFILSIINSSKFKLNSNYK